jgi:cell division protein FtsI (penicillin-binding protein 3)
MAILEDKVADTSTVYDTYGGEIRYSGKQYGFS